MAKNSAANLLTSVDSLFTTQAERDEAKRETVAKIPLDEISDFPNHPFKVREDDSMTEMVESIMLHGVLVPGLVRPKQDGSYEMVAGHRRKMASRLAGKTDMDCIVRELTDEEAIIIMVDSNLQREQLLPSEKAFAYKMKLDALKRQGKRLDLTSTPVGPKLGNRSNQELAEQSPDSKTQIQRYIRLTYLIPELLEMVDNSVTKDKELMQIALRPAVELSYDMELQRRETKEFLNDLTSRDQRMMFAVITMVHVADTKEQLDSDTEILLSTARKHLCQLATMKYQQLDALNTALPIGVRKINALRTLTTESLAVFMPFKVQEIQEVGGIYFGENAISHNLILCNLANLLNQSMFLLGVPGAGKSFFAKLLIIFLALSCPDEDILICDPEGEYSPLVRALRGSVVRIAAGGKDRVNAMEMVEGYGDNNPIVEKSQFIMSLIEQIDKNGVGAHQKSIIDRCTAEVYREQEKTGKVPTLCTLREKLLQQPEPEARDLALAMELFTSGSLDIFAHETNVDTNNRIISYDIHDLGAQLKPAGLLTITDAMLNRVTLNWKKGKRTHIFVDEFHIVYENEYSGNFFTSAWRQFRKRNAYPCAITQNVEYLLDSVQASTMLSNSEFIVMLSQAASDREKLSQLLNISPEQMSYVTNADAGCGLMRYGSALVPFINKFPRDTKLYELITTKPGEGVFTQG